MAIYKNENGTMVKYAGGSGDSGSSGSSAVISSTEPTDQNVGDLWFVVSHRKGDPGLYNEDGIMLMSWDDLDAGVSEEFPLWEGVEGSYPYLGDYLENHSLSGILVLPNTISKINALYHCSSLKEIIIPDSVTTICALAFAGCTALETITLPESITSIEYNVFCNTPHLKEIYFNCSLTNLKHTHAISDCGANEDTTLYFGENISELPYIFYKYYWGNGQTSCDYTIDEGVNHIVIKGNVTTIPKSWADAGTVKDTWLLKSVTLPSTLSTIEEFAFYNQQYIEDLVIPDTVTEIGSGAFSKVPHITYHGTATGAPWGALSMN